jgi:enolase
LKAIENIQAKIKPALVGMDVTKQSEIDEKMIELDGTENKASLGANAILSVSLACCRAASLSVPMNVYQYIQQTTKSPIFQGTVSPMFNVINGGLHGGGNINFQEFMIIPEASKPFADKIRSRIVPTAEKRSAEKRMAAVRRR